MLLIFTNINTHPVCLKRSDLKIWFEKSKSNHSEEFWKKSSSETSKSLNNKYQEVQIFRLITNNFIKNYFLYRYFTGIMTANFMWQTSEKLFLRILFSRTPAVASYKWFI